ncbi:MAG: orotate phosphoribosyltransferase [Candidatus Nealsonbacteria bacterium RBG_13_42_11]|uniref:Orotate phosphoribosyltransferase n=1 Tax=Candidatus Nealsonbacteria bacterium RBG_13_42_11 TaxID=1801663 RepID=A0A1G2DZ68_9BACT|nr:MAG: orotate phosphoribosyltransferase [Candidatus Nealsonbacteria bacterium RBG_13_42_11]
MASGDLIKRYLLKIIEETKALQKGSFTLSSGKKSKYYFDGRKVTLSPAGAFLTSKKIFDLIRHLDIDAIGGPTIGADPIVAAVVLISHLAGKPISGFIIRNDVKKHGTQKTIEGNLPFGGKVVIVDDTLTTGQSILKAIKEVKKENCQVVKIIVLLDRQEGGSEKLREKGYDLSAIFIANEAGEIYPG